MLCAIDQSFLCACPAVSCLRHAANLQAFKASLAMRASLRGVRSGATEQHHRAARSPQFYPQYGLAEEGMPLGAFRDLVPHTRYCGVHPLSATRASDQSPDTSPLGCAASAHFAKRPHPRLVRAHGALVDPCARGAGRGGTYPSRCCRQGILTKAIYPRPCRTPR